MKKLVWCCLLAIVSLALNAQEIVIKGKVKDAGNSEPIIAANVSLLTTDSALVGGMATDTKGSFRLRKIQSGDYLVSVTYLGYKPSVLKLDGVTTSVDLQDIWLEPEAVQLGEVAVAASAMVRKIDRQLLFPSPEQMQKSTDGLDLTRRLSLPRIMVDMAEKNISMANGNVQLRINGVASTSKDVLAIPPADILRVEYHDNPGLRYGEGVDVVLDYITVKRMSGGNFGVDLNHQLNTFWMGDYLYGKYNHGKSEFSLSSFANGHKYSEYWKDVTETFRYPDSELTRRQEGLPDRNYEMYWVTTANYNYREGEKYFLNAKFNMFLYDYPHEYGKSLLSNSVNDRITRLTSYDKQLTKRPSLDIYFFRQLPRKQAIILNAVGTYSNTDSEHQYRETADEAVLTDISTFVRGKRYSVIGEGIYEKELASGDRLTGGVKHTQAYTDNVYTGSGNYTTEMIEAETYLYSQYIGKWKSFVYNIGVGASRQYVSQEGADSYDRWYFRPTVNLTYNINPKLSLRYRYTFRNQNPSLAQLSNVEQWIDSLQIRKGNPGLKPFLFHYNALDFNVNTAKVKTGMTVSYHYYPDAVMEETRFDAVRRLFVRTYDNQKSFSRFSADAYLNYSPFGDYLNINASGGINHFVSEGNQYSHTFTNAYYILNLSSDVKKFTFGLMFYKRAFSFWGETSSEADCFNMLRVGYRLGKVQLGASFSTPFYSTTARYRTKNRSELAPYVSDTRFGDIYPSFRLSFSYHLDFGRKYQSGNRKVNNADNESGILDNRK